MAIKISTPPSIGIVTSMRKAIFRLIVAVMIQESTTMMGALASMRIENIKAICTLVISVVSLVTRLDVEK